MEHLKSVYDVFGLGIIAPRRLRELKSVERDCNNLLDIILKQNGISNESKAQLKQDIFVLMETNFKRDGFFVEFGATNGVDLSNTHWLEKGFGWNGILAEPAMMWHDELQKNRAVSIETDCVWSASGEQLDFNEIETGELSTLKQYSAMNMFSKKGKRGKTYKVNTISLLDLLKRHNAPKDIDYLSIDTEGSEFEILNSFDFDQYNISVITCEHNYTNNQQRIFELLSSKGYKRKFTGLSRCDDWYVKE